MEAADHGTLSLKLRRAATRHENEVRTIRCFSVMFLLAPTVLAGCASAWKNLEPQYPERLRDVKTVSLVPPKVELFEVRGNQVGFMSEWSQTARADLTNAIDRRFGTDAPFAVKWVDLGRSEALRLWHESELRLWALDKNGKPQVIDYGARKPSLPCVPGLVPADAKDADALLLTFAQQSVKTSGTRAFETTTRIIGSLMPAGWVGVPLWLAMDPADYFGSTFGGGYTAIQMCLVESQTGNVLWFYLEEFYGSDTLRDPVSVDRVISEAFQRFQQALTSTGKPPDTEGSGRMIGEK